MASAAPSKAAHSAVAKLAVALREREQLRQQQAATAEILKVIARSPSDVQPVFDTIVRSAVRLCGSLFGSVYRFDGEKLHFAAHHNFPRAALEIAKKNYPSTPDRSHGAGRAILTKSVVRIEDVLRDRAYRRAFAKGGGWRRVLAVPMMHAGKPLGTISVAWVDPGPIPDHQVALLKTFADQAVIAIENARLFNETKEALEHQQASSEILRIVASSVENAAPVFEAIAAAGRRLLPDRRVALLVVRDGELHYVSHAGISAERKAEAAKHFPMPLDRDSVVGSAVLGKRIVQVPDIEAKGVAFSRSIKTSRASGSKAMLAVPLMREGGAIGALAVTRTLPGTFSDKEIALAKTFADQAVIALQNARMFNETKNALARQTATAEILRVIGSSITDVQPVFDAIVKNCHELFKEGGVSLRLVADGELIVRAGVGYNADPVPIDRSSAMGMCVLDRRTVHLPDLDEAMKQMPRLQQLGLKYGYRSGIYAPLMRGGQAIGGIAVMRRQAGAFDEKDIQLLNTFADQAVIAIENVRLFNETKEALEKQTATAEILRVLSANPADTQPVFEAIVRHAARLCDSVYANVFRFDGERLHWAASEGVTAPVLEALKVSYPMAPNRSRVVGRVILEKRVARVENTARDPEYDRAFADVSSHRRILGVPLMRGADPVGAITIGWAEPGPILDRHEDLLKTFADQAVIAIENVRLFNETKESLEQQTATSEILKVISSSPTNVQPVFDAIVQSAARLFPPCNAVLNIREGDRLLRRARGGPRKAVDLEQLNKTHPIFVTETRSASARVVRERRVIEVLDTQALGASEMAKTTGPLANYRSAVVVPLMRDEEAIGALAITHEEPGFKLRDKQLVLLKTFADQAVIAIENVRLFTELQTSNHDLKTALDTQMATSDILRVISRSQTDVQPVFDAIVQSAVRLLRGYSGALSRVSGHEIVLTANTSTDETGDAATKALFPLPLRSEFPHAQAIRAGTPFNVADARTDSRLLEDARAYAHVRGYRSWIVVPMLRQNEAIGAIGVTRREVGGFTDDEIALLQTFADQAVIAIENVRLFNETKEALEQQIATAEILKVMSGTPTDTQPVFDAIARSALRIFGGMDVSVGLVEGDAIHIRAGTLSSTGRGPGARMRLDRDTYAGRVMLDRSEFNIADIEAPDTPPVTRERARLTGWRSIAIVPMLREGVAMGLISIHRSEPVALDEKQFALLRTFADQAVIAIENVRLFKELEARTQALTKSVGQLTALGEVGQAISSTLDLETVLKTIVSHAVKLTGLDAGAVYEYDEQGEAFHLRAAENLGEEIVEVLRTRPIRKGDGVVGRTAVTREPMQIHDTQDESYQSNLRELVIRTGRRALLAVPLMREDHIIGALTVQRNTPGPFAPEVVELLKTFATQSAMAIQNARLFREIEEKGRELEVASQHKSQFLASMSHELRTPLNALLGFNEMLLGDVYGEVPGDMKPPLAQMQSSGRHLLRLINNVLDLAKIEAGRMELALSDYSVHDTVESVRSTLHPLAADKGLEFCVAVPADIPLAHGDPGRITQCLMNLAGNSLKFTKAGKVEISVAMNDGRLRYSVADTGIGIPPDKIEGLFTEFKQTDATIASEYGGTGLGLSISKKFVEMHGGRIWAQSEPGRGSTFIFEIPLRAREGKSA